MFPAEIQYSAYKKPLPISNASYATNIGLVRIKMQPNAKEL